MALFSQRNFAVGITFRKTEVLRSAFIGFALLGDIISMPVFFAIIIGLLVGAFIFGEKVSPREWQGLLMLTGSFVLLVMLA